MKYKVVEDFGSLIKGDILEQRGDVYVLEERINVDGYTSYRYAEFDKEALDEEVNSGRIITIEDEPIDENAKRLNDTINLLNELDKKYYEDYNKLMEEYEKGDVPTCLKVEAETVYENLGKLVNAIRKTLEGEKVKVND